MQKEIVNTDNTAHKENTEPYQTTPENQHDISGRSEGDPTELLSTGRPEESVTSTSLYEEFEELIKGKYKNAFADKVQGIINKRFKEEKLNKEKAAENGGKASPTEQKALEDPKQQDALDTAFNSLINAGIDEDTAYKVLHLDEIMDSSMRYGASIAAKQLADSIRLKGRRPAENGLKCQSGFAPHKGAAGLTPEKRRELAKKALMGEHIGF